MSIITFWLLCLKNQLVIYQCLYFCKQFSRNLFISFSEIVRSDSRYQEVVKKKSRIGFSRKKNSTIMGEKAQNVGNMELFSIFIKFCHYFFLEIIWNEKPYSFLYAVWTLYLGKFCFLSFTPKSSGLIRLQACLTMNISGNDAWISWIFLHGYIHQVKVASEATDFGCMYLGMPNHTQRYVWVV